MNSSMHIRLLCLITIAACSLQVTAQEKVTLEEPKQPDLIAELSSQPDGVLNVKVNDEDPALRENRLILLANIRSVMDQVADFSQIEG